MISKIKIKYCYEYFIEILYKWVLIYVNYFMGIL